MTVSEFSQFGSGASYTLVGNEQLAYLTVTTGTSPNTGVIQFAYSNGELKVNPELSILPLDTGTAALDLSNSGPSGETAFSLSLSGLAASTTYRWALRID